MIIKLIFANTSQSGFRTFFLTVLAIILMIVDQRTDMVRQVRATLSIPLASLQYMVSWPVNWIDHVNQLMSAQEDLVKENVDLKAQQLFLKAQVQRLTAIESENNKLKNLLRSSKQFQGKIEIAQLLAVNADFFGRQVIVDKGSRDAVYVGQPVLDASGVMGQVIQVEPLSSRVLLINDPHSGVPVENIRNGMRGIVMGDSYTNKLRLMNISHTTDVRVGDAFVTSGLGENYPQGYPVGKVISVVHDVGSAFATIILEPDAHLDQSRQVLLVWPNKRVSP